MELGHLLTRSGRTHTEVSSVVLPDFSCLLVCSFRGVRKIAKSDYNLRYVCLSAWNNSAPTVRIFMRYDI